MTPYWLQNLLSPIQNLKGRVISKAFYSREPIRWEGGDELPVYSDHRVGFEQVCPLYLQIDGLTWIKFTTYQKDSEFGLRIADGLSHQELFEGGDEGKPRFENEQGFPQGRVENLEIYVADESLIAEVFFRIEGKSVLLMAAEIHDDVEDHLRLSRHDENIFVITDLDQLGDLGFLDDGGPRLASCFR